MTAIGPGTGSHAVYDWNTDTLRSFRSYPRAHSHATRLQNQGHQIECWTETTHGQDTAPWAGVL